MDRSILNQLKNRLEKIFKQKIKVIEQRGFLEKRQIPSGRKVYSIEATLMFIDIRNSTALTDDNGRKNMVKIYKMYTLLCKKAINENNGIILQIVGDGIMCAFTNNSHRNTGMRAVNAALDINTYINESMNPLLDSELKIGCGIGIRTGHVYITRLVTENSSEIAYPSDITNYASKFCNQAQKEQIILDSKTYEHLDNEYRGYCEIYETDLNDSYIIKDAKWEIQ